MLEQESGLTRVYDNLTQEMITLDNSTSQKEKLMLQQAIKKAKTLDEQVKSIMDSLDRIFKDI